MAGNDKAPGSEREQTNLSLRVEREKTDRALLLKQTESELAADLVVDRARESADAVLLEARQAADKRLDGSTQHALTREEVVEERAVEDQVLQDERDTADASVLREREENAQALSRLLPLEREKTDRHLLTERARSDEELLKRDDFLGIVSHDLRNLIGGIVMSAGMLSQSGPEDEVAARTLTESARIQRYAARMNRLVGDLLDVASMDSGKLAVTACPGDMAALIAETMGMFEPVATAKGITLEAESSESSLHANFDHDRMLQVLANLISNSIKFTSHGGHVQIRAASNEDGIRVSVSDTGAGIAEDSLEVVFERFWQVGKNDRRGVGLGLYISRCIVEAHGGKMWAESKLGEWSTFYFTLPA